MPISDDELEEFSHSVAEKILPHANRIAENLKRVSHLVEMYAELTILRAERSESDATDILRAAVVLLHASLEDFLRDLSVVHLPQATEEVLNTISLAGVNDTGRPEKFLLGRLAAHRGKTVDEVIRESVEQHLSRSNYNNSREIAALLRNIGVDTSWLDTSFADLDAMMQRRHQIVHRADRVDGTPVDTAVTASISSDVVHGWTTATLALMGGVLAQLSLKGMKLPGRQPREPA